MAPGSGGTPPLCKGGPPRDRLDDGPDEEEEDETDMCNRELLRTLLLRGFPPYLVIGTKRGQINFVMSLMTS